MFTSPNISPGHQTPAERSPLGTPPFDDVLAEGSPTATRLPRAQALLLDTLARGLTDARLLLVIGNRRYEVGTAENKETADVVVRVHSPRFFRRVLTEGNLGLGESYMEGEFDFEHGTLEDFLTILLRNRLDRQIRANWRLAVRLAWIRLFDMLRPAHRNVRRHYDLGDDLFETFLDSSLTYSCGYALNSADTLEQLQHQKIDRICRKLVLHPGARLLDVGCGYGSLLVHAALHFHVQGLGVTNSRAHWERASRSVSEAGLNDRVAIRLVDYRSLAAQRDRFNSVVSVGMMEHVPRRDYPRYVRTLARVLTPDGTGLVHTIGASDSKNARDAFIQRYVFPGSRTPTLSELTALLERNDLLILDVENMVRHYAPTLRHWLQRFRARRHTLDPHRYDATFIRMWEYYLACGIAAASASAAAVYQVLFTRNPAFSSPFRRP